MLGVDDNCWPFEGQCMIIRCPVSEFADKTVSIVSLPNAPFSIEYYIPLEIYGIIFH